MGHRPLVGDGYIDPRLIAGRRDGLQTTLGAAGQLHGGPPGCEIHHAHVAPPHPGAQTGAQCLGACLLSRKSLGVSFDPVAPPVRAGALRCREHPVDETVTMPLDHLGDPARIGDVGADAENHEAGRLVRRPRSMAARILRTAADSPSKMASPMIKWPILNSTICGSAAIFSALAKSRPCPACTSSPRPWASAAPRTMRSNSSAAAAALPAASASHQVPV